MDLQQQVTGHGGARAYMTFLPSTPVVAMLNSVLAEHPVHISCTRMVMVIHCAERSQGPTKALNGSRTCISRRGVECRHENLAAALPGLLDVEARVHLEGAET